MSHKILDNLDKPNIPGIIFPERPNSLPEPSVELTLNEYLWEKARQIYSQKALGYDQVFLPDFDESPRRKNFWSVHYEWYDNKGFAIANLYTNRERYDQCNRDYVDPRDKSKVDFVTGKGIFLNDILLSKGTILKNNYGIAYRWFRLGCYHRFLETNPRMFEHVYTCVDCGYVYTTDSSG